MTERATNEPLELRAGLTWEWERSFGDYPASAWTLKYWFKRLGGVDKFDVTATADGDTFVVSVPSATTTGYAADDYSWVAVVSDGTDSFEVDRGTLKVLPRYDQDVALDDRTHAEQMLELVEAAQLAINKGAKSYTIGSRSYTARDLEELRKERDYWRRQVANERAVDEGLPSGPLGRVRYGVPQ